MVGYSIRGHRGGHLEGGHVTGLHEGSYTEKGRVHRGPDPWWARVLEATVVGALKGDMLQGYRFGVIQKRVACIVVLIHGGPKY